MATKCPAPGNRLRALALSGLLATNGCVTAAVWEEVDNTAGAIALTPLSIVADAALIAGFAFLVAGAGCCGCDCDDLTLEFD